LGLGEASIGGEAADHCSHRASRGHGYPRKAFRQINRFVQERLERHLKRRSQRPFRPKEGLTWYAQLHRLGLVPL